MNSSTQHGLEARATGMEAFADFDLPALEQRLREWGCVPSHARRLMRAFYDSAGRADFADLQIGSSLQRRVCEEIALRRSTVLSRSQSADGTLKLLVGF